jgi:hypoxanthine phosphoribosyltransferase
VDAEHVAGDLESVLLTEDQILARVAALARELERDYAGREPVLIGVLGGAATFTVDLARGRQVEVSWMAIRSYGTRNRASGSVRLLKDLDLDIAGRDVIIVDGVIDTGLTMSWLITNPVLVTDAGYPGAGAYRDDPDPFRPDLVVRDVSDLLAVGCAHGW